MSKVTNISTPTIWGITSVLAGLLFIVFNSQIINWIIIIIGFFLFIGGLIPVINSIYKRESLLLLSSLEAIVGIIVLVFNTKLIAILFVLLGAMLILEGIQQINSLMTFKHANGVAVPFLHFLMPILCIIGGVVAIWNPFAVQDALLIFIGWCMLLQGLWTLISILILRFK